LNRRKKMKFTVTIIESERGWGQKTIGKEEFDSEEAAWKFHDNFNEENLGELEVPAYYMKALEPVKE